MIKNNKKGFAFSELLMVTVVIVGIFMIIYSNIFPIMGELENRSKYVDLSSNYVAFYLRKALVGVDLDSKLEGDYAILYSSDGSYGDSVLSSFSDYLDNANVEFVILTKDVIEKDSFSFEQSSELLGFDGLAEYIDYLPVYNNLDDGFEQFRLIIKTATGFSTTLIKFSEADYSSLFTFVDNDISSVSDKLKDLDTVYIPEFVTGIDSNVFKLGELPNLSKIYLNIFKNNTSAYIDIASDAFVMSGRTLNLYINDCEKGSEDTIKAHFGFGSDIVVECLQEGADE